MWKNIRKITTKFGSSWKTNCAFWIATHTCFKIFSYIYSNLPSFFTTLCHSHLLYNQNTNSNPKTIQKKQCWSLTNRNNPWLFQHHQCLIIITLTTTLSNAVHHHHLLLTNPHPRSILSTQAISPVMASPPLHFLSVSVVMLFATVSLIHALCRINPCRLKGCRLHCRL